MAGIKPLEQEVLDAVDYRPPRSKMVGMEPRDLIAQALRDFDYGHGIGKPDGWTWEDAADFIIERTHMRLETRACTSNDPAHRKTWPHAFTGECNAIPAYYFDPLEP